MPLQLRVLIIDDNEDDALLLVRELRRAGYDPAFARVDTEAQLLEALREKWDIVLSDYNLPRFGVLEALRLLQAKAPDIPFIAISGTVTETTILTALKAGAGDYLMKDNLTRLGSAVDRQLKEAAGRKDRRRLEEQLRHAQKMEAVGRLAGGVAHDFNNLLTVITGYSDLLLSAGDLKDASAGAGGDPQARPNGEAPSPTSCWRSAAPTPRSSLGTLIQRSGDATRRRLLRRLIGEDVVLVTIPAASQDAVEADPGRLEQVIMNLVVNARDAMPHGGKLTIETSTLHLNQTFSAKRLGVKAGQYVTHFHHGYGRRHGAPRPRAHLFEPFFTTKNPGRGTGLGLATAYGIMRQSGGSIHVCSELGTAPPCRSICRWLRTARMRSADKDVARPPVNGAETILLVEDEDARSQAHRARCSPARATKCWKRCGEKTPSEFAKRTRAPLTWWSWTW